MLYQSTKGANQNKYSVKIKKEVGAMMSMSDFIEERAERRGEQRGMLKGTEQGASEEVKWIGVF